MKYLLLSLLLAAALAPARVSAETAPAAKPEYGILLLAHGNGPQWNAAVMALRDQVDKKVPTETSFGMFVAASEIQEAQAAADRLTARGVKKIVAVPLFVNSQSEVMDQARYTFGLADEPSKILEAAMKDRAMPGMDHSRTSGAAMSYDSPASRGEAKRGAGAGRVHSKLPLVLTAALDDHPLLADILLSRARELSRSPSKETVILVGHGPVDEKMNEAWLKTMDRLGVVIKSKGGFQAVRSATLRDDAPAAVKEEAARKLRALVDEADNNGGNAVVVPLLLAAGGIEDHLKQALSGAGYAWSGKMLLPDPRLARWALDMGAQGAAQPDVRKYK